MFILIAGIILLLLPFLLIGLFSEKKKGFVCILFFTLLFHSALAILTQSFKIFYYPTIFWVAFFTDLIALAYLIKNKKKYSFNIKNIDWIFLAVFIIAVGTLFQVHFNYTGEIGLTVDKGSSYQSVKNMHYAYPYFSDEWYAVSLVSTSINSHSLPLWDVLSNRFFLNLELFFHSLIAELILILGLDPLTQYAVLSIFINALIIVLAYVLLRLNNVSRLAGSIASLSLLYVTCGANFPGMWHLIPLSSGILFALIGFCFISLGSLLALPAFIVATLFYPPLFLFFALAFGIFMHKRFSPFIFPSMLIVFTTIVVWLKTIPAFDKLISKIVFVSFSAPYFSQINFYEIIPWSVLFFAIFGIIAVFRNKKWLFCELILGSIYWAIYSLTNYRFFAEYERIAVFTSILVVLISGFGIDKIISLLKFNSKKIMTAEILVLAVFLILLPYYTRINKWKAIFLINPVTGGLAFPKPPANNYLVSDDLKLFENVKDKNFLSFGWKGTVIGVATQNHPVFTKQGTISIGKSFNLDKFLASDCKGKTAMAKKMKLDYVYLYEFNCPGFEYASRSREGFVLYKALHDFSKVIQ